MTTTKTLNKVATKHGYIDWEDLVGQIDIHDLYIDEAMRLYAQQFIDAANQIIDPATELLPDTYDEDYEKWFEIVSINKI